MTVRRAFVVVSLLGTSFIASAPVAEAQAPKATVAGGAWKRQVTISVLGGIAAVGTQLFYFQDPFDPITGLFSPSQGKAIGPASGGTGRGWWVAGSNSTTIGRFSPGTELFFGLLQPSGKWLLSGSLSNPNTLSQFMTLSGPPGPLVSQLGSNVGPDDELETYAWGKVSPGDVDYRFVIEAHEASVTPEPATLSLLGLGLAGLGVARRRRKQAK